MTRFLKKHKTALIVIILFIAFVIFTYVWDECRYNKCVKNNKENLRECRSEGGLDEDCSIFENPEELCKEIFH